MKWSGREQSSNIEDRRGMGRGGLAIGGGLGSIAVLVLALLFGVDPSQLLQQSEPSTGAPTSGPNPAEAPLREFTGVVLKDTEDVWNRLFPQQLNRQYREPAMVLFTERDQSACGTAAAAM